MRFSIFLFTLCAVLLAFSFVQAQTKAEIAEQENYRLAAEYSKNRRGLSVLIVKGERTVFEDFQNGFTATDAHQLASGTKSFTGILAILAQEENLLKLDEKVSATITEWKSDPRKSKITIRQLLSLTSGIDTGQNGRPPTYSQAVLSDAKYEPGTTFEYGPAPFQVFGEILRRKLSARKESVTDFMKRRLFDPINLKYADWTTREANPNMPSGAFLTARDWAKFGLFLKNKGKWNGKQIVSKKLFEECIKGTRANPNYGLGFWLNRDWDSKANVAEKTNGRNQQLQDALGLEPETTRISRGGVSKNLPKDLFMAAGAGKQRLYIIPSLDLVVVRQGRQSRFDDEKFLELLIFGKAKKN